ncbi:MAG: hypothetical protein SOY94_01225 [Candidatus Limiplasma sp.]|nr:hypothetical protein [Candidatus Limiplasma sp.]
MKEKIVAKMEEHIRQILDKPEITAEEYMTLRCRLGDIRMEEDRARRAIEAKKNDQRIEELMQTVIADAGVWRNGML